MTDRARHMSLEDLKRQPISRWGMVMWLSVATLVIAWVMFDYLPNRTIGPESAEIERPVPGCLGSDRACSDYWAIEDIRDDLVLVHEHMRREDQRYVDPDLP